MKRLALGRPKDSILSEIYLCDPFCRRVAALSSDEASKFQDGLRVEAEGRLPRGSLHFLTVDQLAFAKMATPRPPELPRPAPVLAKNTTVLAIPTFEKDERSLSLGKFSLALQSALEKRALSTTANTQTESANHLNANNTIGLGWTTPWNPDFDHGTMIFHLQGAFERSMAGSLETVTTSAAGTEERTGHTDGWDGHLLVAWKPDEARWLFGLLGGFRQERLTIEPEAPVAFSTLSQSVYFGTRIKSPWLTLEILKSVVGTTQDSANYRGTAVTASWFSIDLRRTLFQRKFSSALEFGLGAFGGMDIVWQTGSGPRISKVLTANPEYRYLNWAGGLTLSFALNLNHSGELSDVD
ncbi:hypothetical protein WDW37_17960 [Bdellovibrionota bacterium FG-1]